MRSRGGLVLAVGAAVAAAVGLSATPAAPAPGDKPLKDSARSRAIEAIDKAGGTYGFRQLGGENFAALAKRLGYDERSYYHLARLSFGRASRPPLGDAGLRAVAGHIAAFPELEVLELRRCDVTVEGVESLPPLPGLKVLRLDGAGADDAAAAAAAVRFPALESLEAENSGVTAAGEQAVRKLLPKCKVSR